jgi:hypothetical protein
VSEPPKVIKSFAMEGYKPNVSQTITRGYPSKVQGGHVAPTQSAPSNPPSGGSSVKSPAREKK